jgi:hypothetical protein
VKEEKRARASGEARKNNAINGMATTIRIFRDGGIEKEKKNLGGRDIDNAHWESIGKLTIK